MIPVKRQSEPKDFVTEVKLKGEAFLAKHSNPINWKHHEYWTKVLDDLCDKYSRICAYSSHWIPACTGARTVDHFMPKSTHPEEAYQWENYRLACNILNARKGDFEDILDPFTLEEGWFVIDFDTLMVEPGSHLVETDKKRVDTTIKRLKLNNDADCLKERADWLGDYIVGDIPFSHLKRKAPFTAFELERQNLVEAIKSRAPMWLKTRKKVFETERM